MVQVGSRAIESMHCWASGMSFGFWPQPRIIGELCLRLRECVSSVARSLQKMLCVCPSAIFESVSISVMSIVLVGRFVCES